MVVINALQFLLMFVWTALWVTVAGVAGLLTLNSNTPLWFARRIWAPGILAVAGARLSVDPLPALDWSKPYIFVMNHQSMVDIPSAFFSLPTPLRFVAKHSLRWVPFLGWYMWFTGMVFVNRSDRRGAIQSLQQAGERIRAGKSILAYPEGTRSPDGTILPFKKGPFMLALEARVPIVPVAIEGSRNIMPRGTFRFRPGPVRLKVGTPIPTADLDAGARDELMRRTREALSALHRQVGGAGAVGDAIAAVGVEGRA